MPSRVHPGEFFALPQSPQIFKQILMVSGMDRYFQIVKCFRDEDLRADRQPEFTQVDVEISFAHIDLVFGLMEPLIVEIFKEIGVAVQTPFRRLPYAEAMAKYGSDKPDLRFGLEIVDVSSVWADAPFNAFREIVAKGRRRPRAGGSWRRTLFAVGARRAGRAGQAARCGGDPLGAQGRGRHQHEREGGG